MAAHEQLARIMDTAQMLMLQLDSQHRIVFCNAFFRRISGYEDTELVGQTFWNIVRAGEADSLASSPEGDDLSKLPREFAAQLLAADGKRPTVRWQICPSEQEDQQTLLVGTDITHQRKLEARTGRLTSLVQTLQRFSDLILTEDNVDRLAGSICRILAARHYRSCWMAFMEDETFDRVWGSSPKAKLERFEQQLRSGQLPPCIQRALDNDDVVIMRNVATSCRHCTMSDVETDTDGLIIKLHHAGRTYAVLAVHLPAGTVTEEDKVLFSQLAASLAHALEALEIKRDRENTYRALSERSRVLDALFTHVLTPLVLLDRNFNFVRVNEAYAKAGDRPVSDFLGRNHFDLYPSDAIAIFREVVATKNPFSISARPFVYADHPEWSTTYWDWTLAPLLDEDGEVEFLIFSLTDVTELKEAELVLRKQQQKQRELTALLAMAEEQERRRVATVLHDNLAQLLAGIKMNLQGVREELSTAELRQPVERTISLLEEAIGETRALYTRLSPPTLATGNLPDALQWLGEDIEAQWEMRVKTDVTGESRSLSEEIRFTLFQAVRELLNNAHHHGQAEVASVSVHFDNEAVTTEVTDNGIGFDISELGDELQQSEGFGLFNIRERVRYLGGQMDIDSQLGRGTQVIISIPLTLSEDEAERDDDERGISK